MLLSSTYIFPASSNWQVLLIFQVYAAYDVYHPENTQVLHFADWKTKAKIKIQTSKIINKASKSNGEVEGRGKFKYYCVMGIVGGTFVYYFV